MRPEDKELLRRLTMALDGCLPLLEAEAAKEKRREAGKGMRQVTMQERHRHISDLVDEAATRLEAA